MIHFKAIFSIISQKAIFSIMCLGLFSLTSAQPLQPKSTFSNGGAISSSSSAINIGIVGQSFIGRSTSAGMIHQAGFLPGGSISVDASASIVSTNFPANYTLGSSGAPVSVTVSDATLVSDVDFFFKGLSSPGTNFSVRADLQADGNTYTATLTDADFADDIGVTYEFQVTSTNSARTTSNAGVTYTAIADGAQTLGTLSFGSEVSDYQVVAVPYVLSDASVLGVFDELAPYDNTRWRLFNYSGGQTNEFNSFTNLEVGKGYWLIVADQTTITLGAGSASEVTAADPLEITLQPGWNQIGNPFTYSINWGSVLTANGDPAGISNLFQFGGGSISQENVLPAFRGGFVENTTDASVVVQLPPNKDAIGGRKAAAGIVEDLKNPISQNDWSVSLMLSDGKLTNTLGGIGMRTDALLALDSYDISRFPVPFDWLEIVFDESSTELNKSIVPFNESHIWEFSIEGKSNQSAELSWDNSYFGENDKKLVLLDLHTNQLVDMRKSDHLTIYSGVSSKFKIIYGDRAFVDNNALPTSVSLGNVYPNPFDAEVTISFALGGVSSSSYEVAIHVHDLMGREVKKVMSGNFGAGFHSIQWEPQGMVEGMYQLVMDVNGDGQDWKMTKKIIIK